MVKHCDFKTLDTKGSWSLVETAKGLGLTHPEKTGVLQINFMDLFERYSKNLSNHPLAKAVGIQKSKRPLCVLDATAGLGKDSFLLASLGCTVLAIEENFLLHALLKDALIRASLNENTREIVSRIQLIHAEAAEHLPKLVREHRVDVIYLDPMFPQKSKRALPKKEMQLLQALLGESSDDIEKTKNSEKKKTNPPHQNTERLFKLACGLCKKVVIKRPKHSPLLLNQPPCWQWIGESSRFDIYVQNFPELLA